MNKYDEIAKETFSIKGVQYVRLRWFDKVKFEWCSKCVKGEL